jgi:hypothetical protein
MWNVGCQAPLKCQVGPDGKSDCYGEMCPGQDGQRRCKSDNTLDICAGGKWTSKPCKGACMTSGDQLQCAEDVACEGEPTSYEPNDCKGNDTWMLMCYTPCAEGYYRVGPVCWQRCAEGYADHGATCYKSLIPKDWYWKDSYPQTPVGVTDCAPGDTKSESWPYYCYSCIQPCYYDSKMFVEGGGAGCVKPASLK